MGDISVLRLSGANSVSEAAPSDDAANAAPRPSPAISSSTYAVAKNSPQSRIVATASLTSPSARFAGSVEQAYGLMNATQENAVTVTADKKKNDKKDPPPKKDEPKKDPPKKDPPRQDSPKKDPPRQDPPKKDPPKQEPPKKDPPRQEPPKQEPPKKDPPRQEPPKQEPPKKDPPKQEPPKQEPPKKDPPKQEPPKQEPPKKDPPRQEPPKQEPPKKDPPRQDPPKKDPPRKDEPRKDPPPPPRKPKGPKPAPRKPKPAPKPQPRQPRHDPRPNPPPRHPRKPHPNPNPGRFPRRHDHHYPHYHGYIRIIIRDGYYRYDYDGPWNDVDSIYDLERFKYGLDYARLDLLDTPSYYKNDPWYRAEARDVIASYHYLLSRIFDWGSSHMWRDVLHNWEYQNLVRELWEDSLSIIEDYEYYNPYDSSLRREMVSHLFHNLSYSRLSEIPFYDRLVDDIGWEMDRVDRFDR